MKESPKRCEPTKRCSSHGKSYKKDIENRKNEKRKA